MCHESTVQSSAASMAGAGHAGKLRVLALNMCLLPKGLNFSGAYLLDGDDRKIERLGMLVELMHDFDIVLLNEVWACKWSLSTHRNFIGQAIKSGFNVVSDPVGALSNTGNMILSRMPLGNATSMVFKSTAGWQSLVSNGVLHATTRLPDGVLLHLFTTHLQCTTAPPTKTVDAEDVSAEARMLKIVEGGTENVRQRQLLELKAFMDRTVCMEQDKWLLAGDLNIVGGSEEYYDMVDLLGRQSLGAPDFLSTYNTESFLTPPGWRGVEYSVALDHVLTNLANIEDFAVLDDNISDHRGLAVTMDCPRAQRRHATQYEGRGQARGCRNAHEAVWRLPPSMVSWAPAHTVCKRPSGGSMDAAGGVQEQTPVKPTRGRRRGGAVAAARSSPLPECTHQEAQVEVARGSKGAFLAKAAWAPGQLAVRLLMPGAVEFANAMTQTHAYSKIRSRMLTGAAAAASAEHVPAAGLPVGSPLGRGRPQLPVAAIPTSQL